MAKKAKASAATKTSKTQPSKTSGSAPKKAASASAAKKSPSKKLAVKKESTLPKDITQPIQKSLKTGASKSKKEVATPKAADSVKKTNKSEVSKVKPSVKPSALSAVGESSIKPVQPAIVALKKEAGKKPKRPQTIKERFPSTGGSSLDLFKARPKSRPSTMSSSEDEFVDEDEQEVQMVQKMVAEEPAALNKKWKQLHDKHKSKKAIPYKLTEAYEPKTPLVHKTMGWGYIINIVNDRLEVLFEGGVKHLISNYKK